MMSCLKNAVMGKNRGDTSVGAGGEGYECPRLPGSAEGSDSFPCSFFFLFALKR